MDATVKILKLISDHGMTDAQFTREAGISNGLVGQWRTGKQKPSLKNIRKIADYFNMDVGDFISDGEPDAMAKIKADPKKMAIFERLAELDVDTLLKVEQIIDMIKQERT